MTRAADPLELVLELLARGRLATLRARGASMHPFVRDGDVLTLAPVDDLLARGEVVMAVREGSLRIHRLVAREPERARLRGDALAADDGWFALGELTARVISVRRADRARPRWLWAGAVPLVCAPLLRALARLRARLLRRPRPDHQPA